MTIVRILVILAVFALVGSIGAATIESFGPLPDCHHKPLPPRCT